MRDKLRWDQKIAWLRQNPDLWKDLDVTQSLYVTQRVRWRAIVAGLKGAGLISPKTSTVDVPVLDLIVAAKQNESQSAVKDQEPV
jgi:hypothetical protein